MRNCGTAVNRLSSLAGSYTRLMTDDTNAETRRILRELLDSYDAYDNAFSALPGGLWRISA